MRPFPILSLLLSASAAGAVTMTHYSPSAKVPAGFKTYLEGLLKEYETIKATTAFTNYFDNLGILTAGGIDARGKPLILSLKQSLLPLDGKITWNHFPADVDLAIDNADYQLYNVGGTLERTVVDVNCSTVNFAAEFTILKNGGSVSWQAGIGNLDHFNDKTDTGPSNVHCQVT